jgi:hypothetical protein
LRNITGVAKAGVIKFNVDTIILVSAPKEFRYIFAGIYIVVVYAVCCTGP